MSIHEFGGGPAQALPGPLADARPGTRPAQSRVGPGGHPAPTVAGVAAVGAVRCRYCRDRLQLAVTPVGAEALIGEAVTIWCPCARRPELIWRAAKVYIEGHGYAPTIRELARVTGMATQTALGAVKRLETAGLVERGGRAAGGKGQSRALRLVKDTTGRTR